MVVRNFFCEKNLVNQVNELCLDSKPKDYGDLTRKENLESNNNDSRELHSVVTVNPQQYQNKIPEDNENVRKFDYLKYS